MYLPKAFDHPEHARRVMRQHPFASLVCNGADGFPMATGLPLHLQAMDDGCDVLWGHVALGNPQAKRLREHPQALAIFHGPSAYLSPSVYPDEQRVPTWCYVRVHAQVRVVMVDEAEAKDRLLKRLIADHEAAYAQQWRGLPEHYTEGMLKRIQAFALHIERVHCALKLNQHRPESHAEMAAQWARGDEQAQALVDWMKTLEMLP